SGINLWPNPFTTDLKISYDAPANSSLDIHMLDNSGRVIMNTSYSVNRGMNQLSLPGVGKLPSGFYFVRITDKSNNEIFAHKISK
ncbi:MAG: T9SS type A sorting domain-containing protein, partial [Chitinophagaceae bacterium]